jgi:hypothetical protein
MPRIKPKVPCRLGKHATISIFQLQPHKVYLKFHLFKYGQQAYISQCKMSVTPKIISLQTEVSKTETPVLAEGRGSNAQQSWLCLTTFS